MNSGLVDFLFFLSLFSLTIYDSTIYLPSFFFSHSNRTSEKQDKMMEFLKDEINTPEKTKFKRKNIK